MRFLASRTEGHGLDITAIDINDYFLGEARNLALEEGIPDAIDFRLGSAEDIPFPDGSFDAAFAVTVFEECDVDLAIAEMYRVLRPGGRAGVVVRSNDLPVYWNLNVEPDLRAKLNGPRFQGVTAKGCVDATLYQRFAKHFTDLRPHPFWASFPEAQPIVLSNMLATLTPEERASFDRAYAAGRDAGTAFVSNPFHCVVGTKP